MAKYLNSRSQMNENESESEASKPVIDMQDQKGSLRF